MEELGLDSLDAVEVVMAFEDEFGKATFSVLGSQHNAVVILSTTSLSIMYLQLLA